MSYTQFTPEQRYKIYAVLKTEHFLSAKGIIVLHTWFDTSQMQSSAGKRYQIWRSHLDSLVLKSGQINGRSAYC